MSAQPEPEFRTGDRVRVALNERNKTVRTGTVRQAIWHFKDARYNYYLEVDGRSVSKRYYGSDLLRIPSE